MQRQALFVTVGSMLVAGCATTKVTSSWAEPTPQRPQRTLVVAAVPSEATRRNLETDLANKLQEKGLEAEPASDFIQNRNQLTRDRVEEIAKSHGFDSVLMTRFQGVDTQVEYVPGAYDSYWAMGDPWLYEPGYIEERREARLQTSLHKTDNQELLWTAETSVYDPKGTPKEAEKVANALAKRMEKDQVI